MRRGKTRVDRKSSEVGTTSTAAGHRQYCKEMNVINVATGITANRGLRLIAAYRRLHRDTFVEQDKYNKRTCPKITQVPARNTKEHGPPEVQASQNEVEVFQVPIGFLTL